MSQKTYEIRLPIIVREAAQDEGDDRKELALTVAFDIKADSHEHAAQVLHERLEPLVGDP